MENQIQPIGNVNRIKINKKKMVLLIIVIVSLVVVICYLVSVNNKISLYETQYTNKAKQIVADYNLKDANISMKYNGKYDGYRSYDLVVESNSFEKLEDKKKYNLVKSLETIDVSDSSFLVLKRVISGANTYQNNVLYSNVLDKNYDEYYTDGIKHNNGNIENSATSTYEKEPSDDDKAFAWTAAKKEVKERLKSPSTADFPFSYNEQYIKEVETKTFIIKSYVDAENSFGANIRSNFIVKIKKTGENTYTVIDVKIS
ncbi:hypothetical protein [Ruminiclostridium cellulolyticum]|uniref:Uncharacterized protein n=1 Tax=Ruminiclostridium cellulolyticum (strain ATCC 35319 / DSM 5812 / JCM 6584 / H10) TaxID=394503 RepID=B8I8G7_RUMCH|nr:hypothetical protein [Ruminiclostridium cellulolyticum]ACL75200.1 hypothetical protein Ccel_0822 [Ruminiclostridium cellulolyticum H10]